jgi:cytochrome P450
MHTHPKYWGSDSLNWRPQRWILLSESSALAQRPLEHEYLRTPPRGAYVPWSDGARVCPGKKFGQVEFVASMVSLFREHRVEVVPESGESVEMARERVLGVVLDSRVTLLLQMRRPESVALRWVERA